jgi:hypothetical protein
MITGAGGGVMETISPKGNTFDREALLLAVTSVGIGWACFACLMVASYRVIHALL